MLPISPRTKRLFILFSLLVICFAGFSQAPNLLNYQGVARNSVGNPLPNQPMKLRLSVHNLSASGVVVFSETRSITTNAGGLFAVQIGSAGSTSSIGSISGINWQLGDKYLQVEIDPESNNNFSNLGTVQLISVPYAINANSATTAVNLSGIVSIANGGTGASSAAAAKTNLGLGNLDNTSDLLKPISTATQAALDLKATVADVNNLSTAMGSKLNIADSAKGYVTPTQLSAKTFDQTPITNAIATKLNIADSAKGYVTPTQLAAKTFDQTPITNAIATKLNIADSATKYITPTQLASYNFSSGGGGSSIDTSSISNRINAKANSSDVTTSLALKAPLANPTFTGTVNGITKTMVGLGNVDNSTDLSKPISTATQTALDLKESLGNKTIEVSNDGASDVKYPSAKAVKTYVDAQIILSATPLSFTMILPNLWTGFALS